MDLRKVKKLIELAEESGIAELEVTSGDESVRISMLPSAVQPMVTTISEPVHETSAAPAQPQSPPGTPILAPMAGTFYRAPSPDAAPYVEVGQVVAAGDVLCIIESMKMMHEIRAASGGTLAGVQVENGTPVSTGEVLFLIS